jgi:hypothetical protein
VRRFLLSRDPEYFEQLKSMIMPREVNHRVSREDRRAGASCSHGVSNPRARNGLRAKLPLRSLSTAYESCRRPAAPGP